MHGSLIMPQALLCDAQVRQSQIPFSLEIEGGQRWQDLLPLTYNLSHIGEGIVETEDAIRLVAGLNQVSFESELAGALVWRGHQLIALEVGSVSHPEWGKMTWIPDHPSYDEPPQNKFEEALRKRRGFYRALFTTEGAGTQEFSLYSTAVNGRFHKSFLFHRVVIRPVPEAMPRP